MGWEERMRTAVRAVWRDDVRLGWDDGVRFGDLREALAELRAARAEIERLRTAAADERAVIAAACWPDGTDGPRSVEEVVRHVGALHALADSYEAALMGYADAAEARREARADERADVVADLLSEADACDLARLPEAANALRGASRRVESCVHVGAAKGGERG